MNGSCQTPRPNSVPPLLDILVYCSKTSQPPQATPLLEGKPSPILQATYMPCSEVMCQPGMEVVKITWKLQRLRNVDSIRVHDYNYFIEVASCSSRRSTLSAEDRIKSLSCIFSCPRSPFVEWKE